ncbi:hypothetical protein Q3H58_005176 [Pseudomonas psychrotolerans]|nr:hypothetical protein [Pseudomonas psychrotolerans]
MMLMSAGAWIPTCTRSPWNLDDADVDAAIEQLIQHLFLISTWFQG